MIIKDPLNNEETPYDLLGLDPNAPHGDVLQAFPKFVKNPANRTKIAKAQEAVRKLMNAGDRIAVDILYYRLGKIESDVGEIPDLVSYLQDLMAVPALNENELYSDLIKEDFSEDYREISFSNVKVIELKGYDDFQDCKPETIFDK